jgi:enoyl-CoA hydratase/carnithine racemase
MRASVTATASPAIPPPIIKTGFCIPVIVSELFRKKSGLSKAQDQNDSNQGPSNDESVGDPSRDQSPVLTFSGAVATITLCRPSQHNRLDPSDLAVLRQHIAQVQQSSDTQMLVLTGTGAQSFCSGYTLQAIVGQLNEEFENTLQSLEDCSVPTLCALNGSAYGGGTDLALCCDFRIGLVGMKAFMPAARFGLHYHPAGMRRYITHLGLAQAKKFLLTGQTFDHQQLFDCGFLTDLVADSASLQARVEQQAAALALCDVGAVRSMKLQMNAIARGGAGALTDRTEYVKTLGSENLQQRLRGVQ